MNERIKLIREVCLCGLHGRGLEIEDTPENRKKIEECPAYSIVGPPETRDSYLQKWPSERVN